MQGGALLEKLIAGRWIAGVSTGDAIAAAKEFNRHGISGIINYLGEEISSEDEVESTVKKYISIIDTISSTHTSADISLKLSQLGQNIDESLARRSYKKILSHASSRKVFVWLDMETYDKVEDTIKIFLDIGRKGKSGICIQSYLKRSASDIKRLSEYGAIVRLVKGAYTAPYDIAYSSRELTTKNYYALMDYLFRNSHKFTIATHDKDITLKALRLNKGYRRDITHAMLKGIHNQYAVELAKGGENVSIYIPFGEKWKEYAFRRISEGSNMHLVINSLFENQKI
jgi:proline dehydrogenase